MNKCGLQFGKPGSVRPVTGPSANVVRRIVRGMVTTMGANTRKCQSPEIRFDSVVKMLERDPGSQRCVLYPGAAQNPFEAREAKHRNAVYCQCENLPPYIPPPTPDIKLQGGGALLLPPAANSSANATGGSRRSRFRLWYPWTLICQIIKEGRGLNIPRRLFKPSKELQYLTHIQAIALGPHRIWVQAQVAISRNSYIFDPLSPFPGRPFPRLHPLHLLLIRLTSTTIWNLAVERYNGGLGNSQTKRRSTTADAESNVRQVTEIADLELMIQSGAGAPICSWGERETRQF
ncbi:hypothetical protein BKA70DRAFT_1412383 [Coprinopsis sp. MPI-PUGE-AT-0042]|nr:hypothetical protein BKA70DRAFT_1412383 [Coprinopsis sp. MPI-PUGE-AT-0042]